MQRVEFVTRSRQNQDIEKTSSTQAKWLACRTGATELQISMELLAGLAAVASASCMTSCMNKDMHRQCHCKGVWQDRSQKIWELNLASASDNGGRVPPTTWEALAAC